MKLLRVIAWLALIGTPISLLLVLMPPLPGVAGEWVQPVVGGIAALGILVTWIAGSAVALAQGRFRWGAACLLAFPIAFYYVLAVASSPADAA